MPNKNHKPVIKAFLEFEERARRVLKDETQSSPYVDGAKNYLESIRGFVRESGLDCEVTVNSDLDDENFLEDFFKFQYYMRGYIAQLSARLVMIDEDSNGDVDGQEFLRISSDYKIEIHEKLNQIRKIISGVDLAVDKHDKIFDCISALAQEVDRERTRLGTFLSNLMDITNTMGESANNLEPVLKIYGSLFKSLFAAKAESEQLMLEADEVKPLPAPDTE